MPVSPDETEVPQAVENRLRGMEVSKIKLS